MTDEENKCLTEYKKLFCTNCEADCTTSILDCNGYHFFSKGYEQGKKDYITNDRSYVIPTREMSYVEIAKENAELKVQIEKMKNCRNCKNWNWKHSKCEKRLKGDCFKNSKWECVE